MNTIWNWKKPQPVSFARQLAFDHRDPTFDLMRRENIASGKWPENKFKPLSRQYEELGLDRLSDGELSQLYPGVPLSVIPATLHISSALEEKTASKSVLSGATSGYAAPFISATQRALDAVLSSGIGVNTLPSQVAGRSLGSESRASKGRGYDRSSAKYSVGPAGLPDIKHIPGSRTYIYNDPARGTRNVTPFVDEIPGFDWYTDRKLFNRVPRKRPQPVKESRVNLPPGAGTRSVRVVEYRDHLGNRWFADVKNITGPYHGYENTSFRGSGEYKGYQAVYTLGGMLMTSGPQRSTYDYNPPSSLFRIGKHKATDVNPHNSNSKYRDPDLSTVF
jgi:hypothetical protein